MGVPKQIQVIIEQNWTTCEGPKDVEVKMVAGDSTPRDNITKGILPQISPVIPVISHIMVTGLMTACLMTIYPLHSSSLKN
jgi:hypothetical protein